MANNLSASFQAAWLTYQINGVDNGLTRIEDIQANKIMAAFPSKCTLENGTEVLTFEVWVKTNNQVRQFDVYQFYRQARHQNHPPCFDSAKCLGVNYNNANRQH